ncbi:MAG TPA: hypothetical protein VD706_01765, partial [Candidatus Saccharimonadales bacterium]|nr:hypothetical protein [Candidatus Saccharimonadales bacterium]
RTQAARIFLDAAAYIHAYGWRRSGMGIHGQPRCSMGALASAHPHQTWDEALSVLMYEKLKEELDGISLTQFNHRYGGEAVARLFERLAAKLQNQREILYNQ